MKDKGTWDVQASFGKRRNNFIDRYDWNRAFPSVMHIFASYSNCDFELR